MPYFTRLFNAWYTNISGRCVKVIPLHVETLLTPIALAHWIMGDGGFDGHGRGAGRVTLYTNNFTLEEVELLRKLLLENFGLESAIMKVANADSKRGFAIRIPFFILFFKKLICVTNQVDKNKDTFTFYSSIHCFSSHLS
jgi:hypothetical protein